MTLRQKPLKGIVVKGENACDQQFLLFLQFFLLFPKAVFHSFPAMFPILSNSSFFFRQSFMCGLLTHFLILIQSKLRVICIGKKYPYVYSAGLCCYVYLHIYKDTIYKHCYCKRDHDGMD